MSMRHPSDDDLILHFYGEQPPEVAARLDAHLAICPSCRDQWQELRETLRLVDAAPVPEPGPAFERVLWARIAPALAASRRAPWFGWGRPWLLPVAAAVVLLAAIVVPLTTITAPPAGETAPAAVTAAASVEAARDAQARRVLLMALDGHFAQTELLLVELLNSPDGDLQLDFERGAAVELVADSRLYRVTAEETGERRFAIVLEDLESVLVEVARSPEKVNRNDLNVLRTRIDDDGLLFKVRAVTQELRERQQELITVTPNEGTP
jgi:hypothetical protein